MLRLTHAVAGAAAALALTAAVAVPATADQRTVDHRHHGGEYYLSLGDSLSVGDQPNAQGVTLPTDQGYADQLYAAIRHSDRDLRLAKLGCPGETSVTLVNGGICGYMGDQRVSLTGDTGTQLAAALAFLRTHRVRLITINIGANDLNPCIALGSIPAISACLPPVFAAMAQNLASTLAQLRAAAPRATIVGMTYYDPELAAWLSGAAGQAFAQASIALATSFNQVLSSVYQQAGVPAADVFTAFNTTDMTDTVNVPGIGTLPEDVALICQWTWECAPPPVGPNEHANAAGYGVIAKAFLATLSGLRDPF